VLLRGGYLHVLVLNAHCSRCFAELVLTYNGRSLRNVHSLSSRLIISGTPYVREPHTTSSNDNSRVIVQIIQARGLQLHSLLNAGFDSVENDTKFAKQARLSMKNSMLFEKEPVNVTTLLKLREKDMRHVAAAKVKGSKNPRVCHFEVVKEHGNA
jgi:hypothetical protein